MTSTFVNITKEEMEVFLSSQGFSIIPLENSGEIVFGKRVDNNRMKLSLRIYTGIDKRSDVSRGVGEDAIRLSLFYKNSSDEIVKLNGCKRVNRTTNWRKNLQSRINNFNEMLPKHICQKCNAPMIPRKGQFGEFHGCCNYPKCNFTKKDDLND